MASSPLAWVAEVSQFLRLAMHVWLTPPVCTQLLLQGINRDIPSAPLAASASRAISYLRKIERIEFQPLGEPLSKVRSISVWTI